MLITLLLCFFFSMPILPAQKEYAPVPSEPVPHYASPGAMHMDEHEPITPSFREKCTSCWASSEAQTAREVGSCMGTIGCLATGVGACLFIGVPLAVKYCPLGLAFSP